VAYLTGLCATRSKLSDFHSSKITKKQNY